jgi:uroporphyrinogen-III synthase
MRLLVTRPKPDAGREAEALSSRGHEAVVAPLLVIEFLSRVSLQLDGAQGLIATSRNALRALAAHPEIGEALKLPLFAVGEGTARQAQELGFADVTIGPGTGAELAALILDELKPKRGPLVHLAGETLAFDLKGALEGQGFRVRQPVLYRAVPAPSLPAEAVGLLKAGKLDGVILMSPRTARTFAELLARHGLVTQAKSLVCYCLSGAVAEAVATLGFDVRVAARPREEDVLALVDSEAASS